MVIGKPTKMQASYYMKVVCPTRVYSYLKPSSGWWGNRNYYYTKRDTLNLPRSSLYKPLYECMKLFNFANNDKRIGCKFDLTVTLSRTFGFVYFYSPRLRPSCSIYDPGKNTAQIKATSSPFSLCSNAHFRVQFC